MLRKQKRLFIKQNSCKLLGAVLNAVRILNPLQLTTTTGGRTYHPRFIDEATEAHRGYMTGWRTQHMRGRTRSQKVQPQNPCACVFCHAASQRCTHKKDYTNAYVKKTEKDIRAKRYNLVGRNIKMKPTDFYQGQFYLLVRNKFYPSVLPYYYSNAITWVSSLLNK